MNNYQIIPIHSLQLFADGGPAAGSGAEKGAGGSGVTASVAGVQQTGVKGDQQTGTPAAVSTPDAGVQDTTAAPVDRNAEFEKLITGEYKDLYNAKVKDIIQKRLKGPSEAADKYKTLTPALELLARKYGIKDASDVSALLNAIQADDTLIEDAAARAGMDASAYRRLVTAETENAAFRRQQEEDRRKEQGQRQYEAWNRQADTAKQVYPSLNLAAEIQNPKFADLLRSGIDVRTAYEVIHKDDIISGAMQFATQAATKKIANSVAANGARPSENGSGSHGAAVVYQDVSKMTKEQRQNIIRQVAMGKKISF